MHYICFSLLYAFPIDLFYIATAAYRDVASKTKKNKKKTSTHQSTHGTYEKHAFQKASISAPSKIQAQSINDAVTCKNIYKNLSLSLFLTQGGVRFS